MRARVTLAVISLGACDPIWGIDVGVRSPANVALAEVTVAIACPDGIYNAGEPMAATTDARGVTHLGGMGLKFPVGCDLVVAKPGFRTHQIRYADLCPTGPETCDRVFRFDLVLEAE